MENASKALLMAAEVLIAILIASLFALFFSTMSEYTKSYEERKQTEELQAFNNQFEKYIGGATAQDVVTVINLAKEYNEKMEYQAITVTVADTSYNQNSLIEDLHTFLKENTYANNGGDLDYIKYDVTIEKQNGKVNFIEFKDNGKFFN